MAAPAGAPGRRARGLLRGHPAADRAPTGGSGPARGATAEPEMVVWVSEAGPGSAMAPRRAAAPAASGWNSLSASLGEGVQHDPAQPGPAKAAPAHGADRSPWRSRLGCFWRPPGGPGG